MKRQWQVQRQVVVIPDGQRRWDRAYQLLMEWTTPGLSPPPATADGERIREVRHASSDLRAGLDAAAGADADD